VRSCPNPPAESASPGELAFQEQLLLRINSSREQLKNSKTLNQIPGIVLRAAGPSQPATEAQWNGFSAGLFTYALTQQLWQASPATTVQISLSRAAGMVNQLVGKEQQPRLMAQKSLQQPLLAYYLPPDPSIGADGVVTAVEDNGRTVQLWLAGLPAMVLEYYGSNSLLSLSASRAASSLFPSGWKGEGESDSSVPTAVPPAPLTPPPSQSVSRSPNTPSSSSQPLQLQMRSKEGLTAKARIVSNSAADNYSTGGVTPPIQVGQLVQEAIRVLPAISVSLSLWMFAWNELSGWMQRVPLPTTLLYHRWW
jgi:hypothetical protein